MTEDEAKTRPCIGPEGCGKRATEYQEFGVWGASIAQQSAMRAEAIAEWKQFNPRMCIGSACMAWRWAEVILHASHNPSLTSTVITGHCGLAGKP